LNFHHHHNHHHQKSSSMSTTAPRRALNSKNINPNLLKAQYAVRGEIAVRSEQHRQQLLASVESPPTHGLPFDSVISANIGNPQQLDQKPITFFRQVLSILEYPALLETEGLFPADVKERARALLKEVHSVGAYSQSQGVLGIRKSVAKFIESILPRPRPPHPQNPAPTPHQTTSNTHAN
jgi:alanine transaminase